MTVSISYHNYSTYIQDYNSRLRYIFQDVEMVPFAQEKLSISREMNTCVCLLTKGDNFSFGFRNILTLHAENLKHKNVNSVINK